MPTEPQVPEEAVEAGREAFRAGCTVREILELAAPAIRKQERERLARQGDLPEVFGELDPESNVGLLIRAALTVAEEDADQQEHQRITEALTRFQNEPGAGILRRRILDEALAALDSLEDSKEVEGDGR